MKTISMIFGSTFGIIAVAFYNFHHRYLGLLFAIFAITSFIVALFSYFKNRDTTKTDKINIKEFTIDPHGYYTHPDYSFHICITCLTKNNLISPVLNGFCTVCKEPTSETLVSGGEVFIVPDEYD